MSPRDAVQPPHNLEAEEYVIGAMMLSAHAIDACADECSQADFYRETHGMMFAAAIAMRNESRPVDPITLGAELEARGQLKEVGGLERIRDLATLVPATSNAGHHARIVRERAVRRGMANAGRRIYQIGVDEERPVSEGIDEAERVVFDLSQTGQRQDAVTLADTVPETYRLLEELHSGERGQLGLPTGFRAIDAMTAGLQPGNLFIIAGRPSMGKTALAIAFLANIIRAGTPAVIFTLEMSKLEVTQRLIGAEGRIDSTRFRTGELDAEEWHRLAAVSSRLSREPLFIDDQRVTTVADIRSKARRLKMRHPTLSLVVVDYIQLMSTEGSAAENRVQAISQISRSLKLLAGELDLPVVAISQLSRAPESRHDRRPILSDLRESGAIEQDADIVAFVYRDEYYHPEEDDQKGIAEVIFAKHRNGPTDTVKLKFVKRYAQFADLELSDLPT